MRLGVRQKPLEIEAYNCFLIAHNKLMDFAQVSAQKRAHTARSSNE